MFGGASLLIALLQPAPPAAQVVGQPNVPLQAQGQRAAAPVTVLTKSDQIAKAVGSRVQFEGKALNAKLAAVVEHEAFSIYVMDHAAWSASTYGKRVRVIGVLQRTEAFKSHKAPDGTVTQGTGGAVLYVRGAQVEVID